jgi:hypothetical protein
MISKILLLYISQKMIKFIPGLETSLEGKTLFVVIITLFSQHYLLEVLVLSP